MHNDWVDEGMDEEVAALLELSDCNLTRHHDSEGCLCNLRNLLSLIEGLLLEIVLH